VLIEVSKLQGEKAHVRDKSFVFIPADPPFVSTSLQFKRRQLLKRTPDKAQTNLRQIQDELFLYHHHGICKTLRPEMDSPLDASQHLPPSGRPRLGRPRMKDAPVRIRDEASVGRAVVVQFRDY
jgi:hypothetical protein